MTNPKIAIIEKQYTSKKVPAFKVGDTISVDFVIREGDKQRSQTFKGLVIAMKGAGASKMVKIRKISYGVGVEKTFPLYSPNANNIKVLKAGDVRRSKLYYMRDRIGKQAMKVKQGKMVVTIEDAEVPVEGEIAMEAADIPTPEAVDVETVEASADKLEDVEIGEQATEAESASSSEQA